MYLSKRTSTVLLLEIYCCRLCYCGLYCSYCTPADFTAIVCAVADCSIEDCTHNGYASYCTPAYCTASVFIVLYCSYCRPTDCSASICTAKYSTVHIVDLQIVLLQSLLLHIVLLQIADCYVYLK